ncbi:hypothetical protein [Marinicellulosiphila megalodicopiae]|uniref:hypothetical protein n=1 Tax=Marinicellulosiphila megalodicopiae TaxID=2724896 RepID=UPI003BB1B7B5
MLSKAVCEQFIQKHKLDQAYIDKAQKHYVSMIKSFINQKEYNSQSEPLIIGINGCQGSGKSTISDFIGAYIEDQTHYKAVVFSLDDFYLTQEIRQKNGKNIHPLLSVRGVPGTHNVALLQFVLNQLKFNQPVSIPKFNKAKDDVEPKENWTHIKDPVDFIIIEGWCLGVDAQTDLELQEPINTLEKNEDAHRLWRNYVNDAIKQDYQIIYELIQHWVVLKAPNFDTVYRWRKEQEDKLRVKLKNANDMDKSKIMNDEQVTRFIQFFERLTTHGFKTLPSIADYCFELDENREITTVQKNRQTVV